MRELTSDRDGSARFVRDLLNDRRVPTWLRQGHEGVGTRDRLGLIVGTAGARVVTDQHGSDARAGRAGERRWFGSSMALGFWNETEVVGSRGESS